MTIIILIYNPREQPLFYFVPVPVKSRDGTQVLLTSAPHLLRCSSGRMVAVKKLALENKY
jgi:hypothetical protein